MFVVLSVMLVVPVVAIALVIALRLNLFVVVIDLIDLMVCSLLDCSVEVVLLLLSDFLHFVYIKYLAFVYLIFFLVLLSVCPYSLIHQRNYLLDLP